MKTTALSFLALLLCFACASCGGGDSSFVLQPEGTVVLPAAAVKTGGTAGGYEPISVSSEDPYLKLLSGAVLIHPERHSGYDIYFLRMMNRLADRIGNGEMTKEEAEREVNRLWASLLVLSAVLEQNGTDLVVRPEGDPAEAYIRAYEKAAVHVKNILNHAGEARPPALTNGNRTWKS